MIVLGELRRWRAHPSLLVSIGQRSSSGQNVLLPEPGTASPRTVSPVHRLPELVHHQLGTGTITRAATPATTPTASVLQYQELHPHLSKDSWANKQSFQSLPSHYANHMQNVCKFPSSFYGAIEQSGVLMPFNDPNRIPATRKEELERLNHRDLIMQIYAASRRKFVLSLTRWKLNYSARESCIPRITTRTLDLHPSHHQTMQIYAADMQISFSLPPPRYHHLVFFPHLPPFPSAP